MSSINVVRSDYMLNTTHTEKERDTSQFQSSLFRVRGREEGEGKSEKESFSAYVAFL